LEARHKLEEAQVIFEHDLAEKDKDLKEIQNALEGQR